MRLYNFGCLDDLIWNRTNKKQIPSHFAAAGVLIPRPSIQLMTAADPFSTVILYYNQIYRMLGIPAALANTLFGFNLLKIFYIFGCVFFVFFCQMRPVGEESRLYTWMNDDRCCVRSDASHLCC